MSRISRKAEHLRYALDTDPAGPNGFDDIRFVHHALPASSYSALSLHTAIGELAMSSPIFLNAMTGGAPETEAVNRDLAVAARERGLAMAVGSQTAALHDPAMRRTFTVVRRVNPNGMVFANVGANVTVEEARAAVEMLEADALQLHLNPLQELIMPEGDRDFRRVEERVAAIAEAVPVPVIVKEVGFGLSGDVVRRLARLGVTAVDVGGRGGTNFAAVENRRRAAALRGFDRWGLTTAESLLEALHALEGRSVAVIASGGIRHGVDVAKALALGADAVGVAGRFLRVWRDGGVPALLAEIDAFHEELKVAMTALGAETVAALRRAALVVSGATYHWCVLRGIDVTAYARRS